MSDHPALDDAVVLWSAPADERAGRPLLVLLHGYGADERDLFGLASYLPPEYVIAAVRAPLTPPFPSPGYSWYPIEGLEQRDPTRVTAAARGVLAWLDTMADAGTVGLLGFSQGAAIALQALRLAPQRIGFVVALSGYVSPGDLPADEELAEVRPPVFWGRGTADDVIPAPLIQHSIEWLPRHVELSGRVYPGLAHAVSQEELGDIDTFLRKRLDD